MKLAATFALLLAASTPEGVTFSAKSVNVAGVNVSWPHSSPTSRSTTDTIRAGISTIGGS